MPHQNSRNAGFTKLTQHQNSSKVRFHKAHVNTKTAVMQGFTKLAYTKLDMTDMLQKGKPK